MVPYSWRRPAFRGPTEPLHGEGQPSRVAHKSHPWRNPAVRGLTEGALITPFEGPTELFILKAYEVAKAEGYRFYSFGDAMLIS